MAITWSDINNGEAASSVRSKLNSLGQSAASFSSEVLDNLNIKILSFSNSTVATTAWQSNATYVNFPYRAAVTCNGVTANDTPLVMFSATDQESGNFTGADTDTNIVYIYCAAIPSSTVTIPNIIVLQGVSLNG